jgi:VWFA-related protein
MTVRRLALVLLAVTWAGSAGSAQSARTQTRFRTGVDIVRLDVSVLDAHRRPVRGLAAEDFTVLEDGQLRPIVTFAAVDLPDADEPTAGWQRDVASDVATNQASAQRLVVIVMDDGLTQGDPANSVTARQVARSVIDRLGPNDLAAVVFTFVGRSQNFTRDRRLLRAAADSFVPKSPIVAGPYSAASSTSTTAASNAVNPMDAASRAAIAGGTPLGCTLGDGQNCLNATLRNVARALADAPIGRKSVVLISSGVPEVPESQEAIGDVQDTLRTLQLANVIVYPFDPTGLTAAGLVGARFDSLRTLAEETGGRATLATNAPASHVPQVFVENGSYYLLGIQPATAAEDGRFRRIRVNVRTPGAEVRTREGYYAPGGSRPRSGKPAVETTRLDAAFNAAVPSGTLPIGLALAPFAQPGSKDAAVVVTVAVRRPVTDAASVEKLDLRMAAFDSAVRRRAGLRETIEITLRPHVSGERRFEFQSKLALRPGRYEIHVAAEVPTDAGGVVAQIDVPDFPRLALSLSGLVLGWPERDASGTLRDLLPVLPTTTRAFVVGQQVAAFLRIYQGSSDTPQPVRVRTRIVDAADRREYEQVAEIDAARFRPARSADFRLDLPLASLGEGEHLLTIDVSRGTTSERRDVRFAVKRR